jgi:hypothetical protein
VGVRERAHLLKASFLQELREQAAVEVEDVLGHLE